MTISLRWLVCLGLFTLGSPAFCLSVGDEVPGLVVKTVLQHGPALLEPFMLKQYRGGTIILVCWKETGASGTAKRKVHEELAALIQEYRGKGVLVLGVSDDKDLVLKGSGEMGLRAPILILSPAELQKLGPVEDFVRRRLVVDERGRLAAEGQPPTLKDPIAKLQEKRTPYGRWMTLTQPYFTLFSTVARVQAAQQSINEGKIGSALAKARLMAKDTKDEALANEAKYVVDTCDAWLNEATAIETAALAIGDAYTASVVATQVAALTTGDESSTAAKERLKAHKTDPSFALSKDFYDTWSKTWPMPKDAGDTVLQKWADKHQNSSFATMVASWLSLK